MFCTDIAQMNRARYPVHLAGRVVDRYAVRVHDACVSSRPWGREGEVLIRGTVLLFGTWKGV